MSLPMKRCPSPHHVGDRVLSVGRFCLNRTTFDGRQGWCRSCMAVDNQARRNGTWEPTPIAPWLHGTDNGYSNHGCRDNGSTAPCPASPTCSQVRSAWTKDYRQKNLAAIRAKGVLYTAAHRAEKRSYTDRNAQQIAERHVAYLREHPWYGRASRQTRRARQAGLDHEPVNVLVLGDRDDWTCRECWLPVDPRLEHPDRLSKSIGHFIGVAEGGPTTYANTQLEHLACSQRKNRRTA